jgi:hypothetical protein
VRRKVYSTKVLFNAVSDLWTSCKVALVHAVLAEELSRPGTGAFSAAPAPGPRWVLWSDGDVVCYDEDTNATTPHFDILNRQSLCVTENGIAE